MQAEVFDPLHDGGIQAGQEARAHAPGACAKPQVEAGRLDLAIGEGQGVGDQARLGHGLDLVCRENAAAAQPGGSRFNWVRHGI